MSRLTRLTDVADPTHPAELFVKPQLLSRMPASSFRVPVDLQRTKISDLAPVIAATLASHAQDYPEARVLFDGSPDGLMFSKAGFHLAIDTVSGHVTSNGDSIPPSQMSSSLALHGFTAGSTLHVCHASDLKRALSKIKV